MSKTRDPGCLRPGLTERTPMIATDIERQIDKWFVEGIEQAHLDFKSGEDNSGRYGENTSAELWYGRGYCYHWWLANLSRTEKELEAVRAAAPVLPASMLDGVEFDDGTLAIDTENFLATLNGQGIHLTPTEFDLLLFMARRAGQLLDAAYIFENVWSSDCDNGVNAVKHYVFRLRRKIETAGHQYIESRRGFGYKFIPRLAGS